MNHTALVRAVYGVPWAITEEKMAEIIDFVNLKARGENVSQSRIEELTAEARANSEGRAARQVGDVAIIPILGTLINRETSFSRSSGIASYQAITRDLRAAMGDESVDSVLLDIDSPGGTVEGVSDLAKEIRRARNKKTINASVNGFGASAAYYIAAQATRISMTETSQVGSIGVMVTHNDLSGALEKEGVKVTTITAGKHKGAGSPFKPLSDDDRAEMQAMANEFFELMVSDIAKGRGVTKSAVKKTFGEGRMVRPKAALESGMVDAIETTESAVATTLAQNLKKAAAAKVMTVTDFERFLRDAGFDRQDAKTFASVGFKGQRDADLGQALINSAEKFFI